MAINENTKNLLKNFETYLSKERNNSVITTLLPGANSESYIVDDDHNFLKKTESKELKRKIAFLNLPIVMYKHTLNRAKCIKDVSIN